MTVRLTEIVHGLEIGPVGTCCQTGALGQAGAEVRHSIQRAEHLRRLRPVQAKIAINRTKAAPRTISQGSSALRPLAMAWLMIRFGFGVVVVVKFTGAR
jgi:hypothetical protein